jgi:hypothetical protein
MTLKKIIIYLIYSITLLIGLYISENSSGGAKKDFSYLYPFMQNFSENIYEGVFFFFESQGSIIHSPVFYILIGFIHRFVEEILFLKIIYIIISCFLPIIFYQILREKINDNKFELILFYFSLIIFYSPYFRSSSIWLLGDNLSLIFFSLSVLFYLKGINLNKDYYFFLSIVSLIICSYIRYYYCIYAIFFIYEYYKYLDKKNFIRLILLSVSLSVPALIYFYYLFFNTVFANALSSFGGLNYINTSVQILNIILVYTLIIIILSIKEFLFYLNNNKIKFIFFSFIFLIIYLINDIFFLSTQSIPTSGGGIIFKLFYIINLDNISYLYITSLISFIFIDFIFANNRKFNYMILIIIILSLPLNIIFQKYLDPLIFIILFGLVRSKIIYNLLIEKNKLKYLHLYFFSCFTVALIYYYNI